MRKPNLFLVGSPKSGTSLLWKILKDHPDIFFSKNPEKEINYFSYDELVHNSYYKDYKVKDEYSYLNLFKNGQSVKYLVDGSVSYFAYKTVPKKIFAFNPKAKIVIMVRDPVSRAFSHYNMDRRMGYAVKPFLEYLKNEDNKYHRFIHQYIENSLYFKHINNYLEYFDRDQIFILNLDQINKEIIKLYDFLGINLIEFKFNDKFVNANKAPRNSISRLFQHNRYLVTILKRFTPKLVVRFFEPFLYKKAELVELNADERRMLEKYTSDDYFMFNKKYIK